VERKGLLAIMGSVMDSIFPDDVYAFIMASPRKGLHLLEAMRMHSTKMLTIDMRAVLGRSPGPLGSAGGCKK